MTVSVYVRVASNCGLLSSRLGQSFLLLAETNLLGIFK